MNEPDHIIYEIFALLGFHESKDRKILESFLNNLYRFSNDFPLKKVKIPQDLRSINIVNRLYQNTKPKREEKIWSQEEIDFIDKLLLLNKTRTLYKMLSKFKCSKSELEN